MNEKNPMNEPIRRLQRELDALNAELNARRDPSAPVDPEKAAEALDALFSARESLFRAGNAGAAEEDGRDYPVLKRRKQAILRLTDEAQRRFAEKYPSLSIPDELMRFNAPLASLSFQTLNRQYSVELAAAIWMLDYLKTCGLYEEASRYFPTARAELDSIELPNLSDAVHTDDELRAMMYVIRHRSRGMNGCRERIAFCDEADALMDSADREASQDRRNFNSVMALIDGEIVEAAGELFETALWDYFDQLLAAADRLDRERIGEKTALRDATAAQLASLQAEPPFAVSRDPDMSADCFTVSASGCEPFPSFAKVAELNRLSERAREAEHAAEAVYFNLLSAPDWDAGDLPDDGEMQAFSAMELPVIRNPYDICFGFLVLLCENSDAVWLYNLSLSVVAFACHALPWAESAAAPDGGLRIDFDYLSSLIGKKSDTDEDDADDRLYERCIPSPLLKYRRVNTSIAGLTFLSSGMIPPRTGDSISFTRMLLHETALSPEAQDLLYHYFAFAHAVNHREDDFRALDDSRISEDQETEKSAEDQEAEIKKLRADLKRLRSDLHRSVQQNKTLSAELSDVRRQLETSGAELAELRSMIRESCDTDEASPTVVSFPYTAKRRTLIVGGRESWVKAIRPLLNNVRYLSPSEQPNPGVILNSEVVWLQTNAMGHSSFYKIIDLIRRNDIKVCYFKYAGAEKCAEQLALEELGTEEADSTPADT